MLTAYCILLTAYCFFASIQLSPTPVSATSGTSISTASRPSATVASFVTVPGGAQARVVETPPFQRATTFASMDTPGPYEANATEAFYNITLPDPSWSKEKQEEYLQGYNYPLLSNVSVHEVWPGHYTQFLWVKNNPELSKVRKLTAAGSNAEGWAHYSEEMVLDEGFMNNDPRYRLAQLVDALLRDCRYIVGIKMHTQGMTQQQAREFFVKEGRQQPVVGEMETKRGTGDPTYLMYTLGKLEILKLRADYRRKMLPLLVRRALDQLGGA